MPEGPEIRIEADRIAKALTGQTAEAVFFAFDHLKPFAEPLTGQTIAEVAPRGKALLIRFESGLHIYSHNQLYGRWYVRRRDQYPQTNRQLRLALHTQRHSALLYSASDIEVLQADEVDDHPFLTKLGPDLLNPSLTVDAVAARLNSPRFRRRRLASLLLDQHCLCGPGNYLRSEILFVAKLHPTARPMDLDDDQLHALGDAALTLTRRSYETQGITVESARVNRLKEQGWPRRRYRFYVFSREDEDCHHCGGIITRETHGSRRLYLCETCQRPPSR